LKQATAILILLVLMSALAGCGQRGKESAAPEAIEPKGKVYYTYFDTVSYVYDYAGDSAERFDDRSAEVSLILKEYHQLFDIYHEYTGVTNLCSLNKAAGGEALELDPRLIDFLLCARDMYYKTGGEMNVMLGAVLHLWHDCREAASEDPAHATIPTEEALREAAGSDLVLIPYENEEKTTLRQVLTSIPGREEIRSIAVFIGPEGGFSDKEIEAAEAAGARSVTLGKTILRTETAGVAAVAMIMYEMEMEK
jgi:thiamine biosynthesis lipoprotein